MNENTDRHEMETFREALECALNDYDARDNISKLPWKKAVELGWGKKFIRVMVGDKMTEDTASLKAGEFSNRYAYCFIDIATGDILKSDGWKRPAKGARGNIRAGGPENWWSGALGPYGAAYLR